MTKAGILYFTGSILIGLGFALNMPEVLKYIIFGIALLIMGYAIFIHLKK